MSLASRYPTAARRSRWLLGAAAAILLASAPAEAARQETLRWMQPDASGVAGFRIWVGTTPGQYLGALDVGWIAPNGYGIYKAEIWVADQATVYFAVSAYSADHQESPKSNELVRIASLQDPGTGGTTGGTDSGGTTGGTGSGGTSTGGTDSGGTTGGTSTGGTSTGGTGTGGTGTGGTGTSPAPSVVSVTDLASILSTWQIEGTGDFNGDGRADLLFFDPATQGRLAMIMSGAQPTGGGYVSLGSNAKVVGFGDVDRTGTDDILWIDASRRLRVTFMGGGVIGSAVLGNLPSDVHPLAVGDFDRDGRVDFFWRNTLGTEHWLWILSMGRTPTAYPIPAPARGWVAVGAADTNADGTPDPLWIDGATSDVFAVPLSGPGALHPFPLGGWPNGGYRLADAGDFDGNGHADLLFVPDGGSATRPLLRLVDALGFLQVQLDPIGAESRSVGVGDLDADGDADLVWGGAGVQPPSVWELDQP